MKHYYTTLSDGNFYRGKVYHYDESGEKEMVDFMTDALYATKGEAMDAAVEYAEEHELDSELG